jgi:ferrous iron transport protein B
MTSPASGTLHPALALGTCSSPPRKAMAALVGNPNTGKTTLFNALSGLRQHVGNYPGVTVETKKGQMTCAGQPFDLLDLPGTYSLAPRSPDEMVAVDVILGLRQEERRPDVVVAIVDASNLDRNLYLTTQALELGVPIVIALNMIDVAKKQGLRIDHELMSRLLNVPVVPIQANKGKGLEPLRKAIAAAARHDFPAGPPAGSSLVPPRPCFPDAFEREVQSLNQRLHAEVPEYLVRRLLLDVGGYAERQALQRHGAELRLYLEQARARLAEAGCAVATVEARTRYGWIRQLTQRCVQRPQKRVVAWTDRIDRILTHRFWGTLLFLAIMFLVFQSIFTWARPLMNLINGGKNLLGDWLNDTLPAGPLTSLLVEGVVEGVGGILVFLPQIMILFAFIAILEDCGYMARAAFLMDKIMARCGLSGKSFIPLLSSLACAVPGIMATRVIENRRDRLATILVAPLMTCSARLPVYTLLIGAFLTKGYSWWVPGTVMFGLYALGLIAAPIVALILKRTLLRGETPVFVMEMPLYKRPSPRAVQRRVFDSAWAFVRRAGTVILATMILVWALLYFPAADGQGSTYPARIAEMQEGIAEETKESEQLRNEIKSLQPEQASAQQERLKELEEKTAPVEKEINELTFLWKRQSYLGRMGQAIEPVVKPLGWDWRIGVATLASFPAREVVVGTLGIVYQVGKVESDSLAEEKDLTEHKLSKALISAQWEGGTQKLFSVPVALSVMVFFALCCQCASTLAVIRRETRSWRWPLFTFAYMTVLAYIGALIVYQVGSRLV